MEKLIMISHEDNVELEMSGSPENVANCLYNAALEEKSGILGLILDAASMAYQREKGAKMSKWVDFNDEEPIEGDWITILFPPEQLKDPITIKWNKSTEIIDGCRWFQVKKV